MYLARMLTGSGLSRDVAVKLLRASLDPSETLRLRDEAHLLAALNHRAIVQIYDLTEIEGRAALVTEFVDGIDLETIITDTGPLTTKLALEIVGEVAGALHVALTTPAPQSGQPLGLVHRDVKPANIRVARSGAVKLLDFGIAMSSEVGREAQTGTGVILGTRGYLAPERVTDEGVGPPSDVYALGCVLYEALAGDRLYDGIGQVQLFRISVDGRHHEEFLREPLAHIEHRAGGAVRRVLERALAFDPAHRMAAGELEQACDELASTLPGPSLRRWARERAWKEPAAVVGSLDGRVVDAVATLGGNHPPTPAPRRSSSGPLTPELPVPEAPPWWAIGGVVAATGLLFSLTIALAVVAYAIFWPGSSGPASVGTTAPAPADPVAVTAVSDPVKPPVQAPVSVPVATPVAAPEPSAITTPSATTPPAPSVIDPHPRTQVAAGTTATPAASRSSASAPPASAPDEANPWGSSAAAAPAAPPRGTVYVLGGIPVELRAGGRSFPAGSVPAGSYGVWANFGGGYASAGTVTVSGSAAVTLRCSKTMMSCEQER